MKINNKPDFLCKEEDKYRERILITAYVSGMVIAAMLMLYHLVFEEFGHFINFIIPIGVLYVNLKLLLKTKNIRFYGNLSLIIFWIGLFCTIIFPYSGETFIILLIVFPYYVFQMKELKPAILIILIYYIFFFAYYGLAKIYSLPWNVDLTDSQIGMIFIAIVIIMMIYYHDRDQKNNLLQLIIDKILKDPYTGLLNKEALLEYLTHGGSYLVAIVRIENIEELINVFGYEFLEKIYQIVGEYIVKLKNKYGYQVFKLGNSEFGLLVKSKHFGFNQHTAQTYLNSFYNDLSVKNIRVDNITLSITCRIGGDIVENGGKNCLSRANWALKLARDNRKNVHVLNGDRSKEGLDAKNNAVEYMNKLNILMENIKYKLFQVHYQPIVDIESKEISFYEGLLRVNHSKRYISVYPFLEIAKLTEMYDRLTEYVLKEAVRMIEKKRVRISINISLRDILNPNFIPILKKEVEKCPKNSLILEIVETDDLSDVKLINQFIKKVYQLDCGIAIDDFGSGYSNFNILLNFTNLDYLKLDGELIKIVKQNKKARMVVKGIVTFCKMNSVKTIAEHVEDEDIFEIVKGLGVDYCQGYYIQKPNLTID